MIITLYTQQTTMHSSTSRERTYEQSVLQSTGNSSTNTTKQLDREGHSTTNAVAQPWISRREEIIVDIPSLRWEPHKSK
jgi:hypothetical protein